MQIILKHLNYQKIAPNNQKLLELRRRALGELKKLQESKEEKVKKDYEILSSVARWRANFEELKSTFML